MTTAHEVSSSGAVSTYWLSDWQLVDITDPAVPPCGIYHTICQYLEVTKLGDNSWAVQGATDWAGAVGNSPISTHAPSFADTHDEVLENLGFTISTDPASPTVSDVQPSLVGAVDDPEDLPQVGAPWGFYGVRNTDECWLYFTNYRGDLPGRWTSTDWDEVEPAYGPLNLVPNVP